VLGNNKLSSISCFSFSKKAKLTVLDLSFNQIKNLQWAVINHLPKADRIVDNLCIEGNDLALTPSQLKIIEKLTTLVTSEEMAYLVRSSD